MLAALIDTRLTEQGKTRRCFVSDMGVRDVDAALNRFNRLLQEGTNNEQWLCRLAEKLNLDVQKIIWANRVTVLLRARASSEAGFTPYIEYTFEGFEQPDAVMLLAREQWQFKLPPLENPDMPTRDFVSARRLYKQHFISHRGRCFGRRINGFRYYWAKNQAIEFDIYGLVKVIVPAREPPKKRFVSRHVLRSVGKPKLLVIHNR